MSERERSLSDTLGSRIGGMVRRRKRLFAALGRGARRCRHCELLQRTVAAKEKHEPKCIARRQAAK